MNDLPKITPDLQAKIASTQAEQRKADEIGGQAATEALPGPLRQAFSSVPAIVVGPFSVRRFVDGDFITLSEIGHPLSSFERAMNGSYKGEPVGEHAWQICWLMTRPRADVRAAMKNGAAFAKEEAAKLFGDEFTPIELAEIMQAIIKQMLIYSGAHLQLEQKTEGENSSPPRL